MSLPPPTLRPGTIADAEVALSWSPSADALRLWAGHLVRWPATAASLWEDIATLPYTTFAFHSVDRGMVGFGQVRHREGKYGHLARVIVSPQRRGEGLGRALCVQLMSKARELHPTISGFSLYVYDTNATAMNLYRTLGFVESGKDPELPNVFLMLAPLSASPKG